jgi:hypothetical protein
MMRFCMPASGSPRRDRSCNVTGPLERPSGAGPELLRDPCSSSGGKNAQVECGGTWHHRAAEWPRPPSCATSCRDSSEIRRYASEKALWDRLGKFHEPWSERGDELSMRPGIRSDTNEVGGFKIRLGRSNWQGTSLTPDRGQDQGVGKPDGRAKRDDVKQWHWKSTMDLNVSFVGDQIIASMNQYTPTDVASLKGKLAQYRSGTKLWLNIFCSPEHVALVHATIAAIAAERGFELARPQPAN